MKNIKIPLIYLFVIMLGTFSWINDITYVEAFKGQVVTSGSQEYKKEDAANKVYDQGNIIIAGLTGIGSLSLLILFVKRVFDLGSAAHNSKARQDAIMGLLYVGIGFALLGGTSLFFAIAAGLFG